MSHRERSTSPPHRLGLLIGAGYFSDFHLDAWQRMERASIVAICDRDEQKVNAAAEKYGIKNVFNDVDAALAQPDIDFVDIATGPTNRLELIRRVTERRLPMICQKPLANDFAEASQILELAESSGSPFMIHENFRFQPWYREIKRLLDAGVIGRDLHTITMRTRMGDGWGADAYLDRQPYFRTMQRLLVHETGVHFIDTFRYLAGEVTGCSAQLRRLNEVIVGEDACLLTLQMDCGATAVWDANRYNEPDSDNPRYTFGRMRVEADGGTITLASDGELTIHPLGKTAYRHDYTPSRHGFAGDCVLACQEHFLNVLDDELTCETSPVEYRKTLQVVEAAYESNRLRQAVDPRSVTAADATGRESVGFGPTASTLPATVTGNRPKQVATQQRVIDLSLRVNNAMPGVEITPCKTIETHGWNATTLTMYSHAGTHMDAPRHFLPAGQTLDAQDLSVCCGRARLVDLPATLPRDLITVEDVTTAIGDVFAGDRLILRTGWHRHFGTPAYRDELPRISIELARWFVQKQVALLGVEPPSVADVNNPEELTDVHQTLFRGGVLIVEGLAHLDQITHGEFEFIALPLNIEGGDGCPVRAIAIVDEEEIS